MDPPKVVCIFIILYMIYFLPGLYVRYARHPFNTRTCLRTTWDKPTRNISAHTVYILYMIYFISGWYVRCARHHFNTQTCWRTTWDKPTQNTHAHTVWKSLSVINRCDSYIGSHLFPFVTCSNVPAISFHGVLMSLQYNLHCKDSEFPSNFDVVPKPCQGSRMLQTWLLLCELLLSLQSTRRTPTMSYV